MRRGSPAPYRLRHGLHPVDLCDEAALRASHRARTQAHQHDRPHAPFWSPEEAVRVFSTADPEERYVPLVVEVGAQEGRKLLIGMAHVPCDADGSHPVHRFADRHGFAVGNTEVRRRLQLPVPAETLRAWSEEARPHHDGYQVATYVDWLPVELHPSFVQLLNQLAVDAPTGDIDFEAGAMTVEIYEQQTRNRVDTGRKVITTVAVKDGEAVAHSTLSVPPGHDSMPHLHQWGTLVRADHRGHRLGLAVKAANLRAVQDLHPERTLISTSNSPVNGPMVAINEKMGFRPVETSVEFRPHAVSRAESGPCPSWSCCTGTTSTAGSTALRG